MRNGVHPAWINLITGEIYIGSAIDGRKRLKQYSTSTHLNRNRLIYNSLKKYGHSNFRLGIIKVIGDTSNVSVKTQLEHEQFYLDIIFSDSNITHLNLAVTRGSTLGFKHSDKFREDRSGFKNPMYGREYSA